MAWSQITLSKLSMEALYPCSIQSLGGFILSVLKGTSYYINRIDPPIPTPELIHEEYFFYNKTIFQEHMFGLFFREYYCDISNLDPDLISTLSSINSHKSFFISEVL